MIQSPRKLRFLAVGIAVLVAVAVLSALAWRFLPDRSAGGASSPATTTALPLKIVTEQAGLTAITAADLQRAGVDPAVVADEQWQLRKEDQPVPVLPLGRGKDLQLVFYAETSDNPYSAQQVYWLEVAPEQGLRPAARTVTLSPEKPRSVVSGTLRLDWRQLYNSRLPQDPLTSTDVVTAAVAPASGERPTIDRWLGETLFGGRQLVLPFVLADLAPGPAELHLRLWANTSSPEANPDHRVQLLLNDQPLAEGTHEGQGFWSITADLPAGLLRQGENSLTLISPGDTGARVEQNNPDWLQITYPQGLTAQDGALHFAQSRGEVVLTGFRAGERLLLWDVSAPDNPLQLLASQELRAESDGLAFSDPDANADLHEYVAATISGLRKPTSITAAVSGDLRSAEPADYLLIGPANLLQAAQPLAEWRQQHGLKPLAVDVEAIYEQFGAGRRGPAAIRNFLRYAREQWPSPPRFVLLVGDASYDPRGYLGIAGHAVDHMPTCLVDTYFVGETASDHCYADLEDDLAPELAVGRLPAETADEVNAIVAKIIAYEQMPTDADWLRNALVVADAEVEFTSASQRIAGEALSPAGFQVDTLYLNDPSLAEPAAARQRLFAALDAGRALINYAGHGSPRWWAGELLSSEDAAGLHNQSRLPIITAMTCLTGFFHHPSTVSLSEALLWADGGAVAAFMPSSEGITTEQLPVAMGFYQHLVGGDHSTLGEATVAAKGDLVESGKTNADMIRTFNLLGDPGLRLPFLR